MMIPTREESVSLQDRLARRIEATLRATAVEPARAAAVARAVALYCAEDAAASTCSPDGLALLTAKALSSLGEDEAAECVLSSAPPLDALAGCLRAFAPSPFLIALIDAGVVRPLRWPAMSPGLTVVLDLRRVRRDASALLELAYVESMHRLVDAAASAWSTSHGEGVLAVRGLENHVGQVEATAPLRGELVAALRARLAHQAEQRGWPRVPAVIDLG